MNKEFSVRSAKTLKTRSQWNDVKCQKKNFQHEIYIWHICMYVYIYIYICSVFQFILTLAFNPGNVNVDFYFCDSNFVL